MFLAVSYNSGQFNKTFDKKLFTMQLLIKKAKYAVMLACYRFVLIEASFSINSKYNIFIPVQNLI